MYCPEEFPVTLVVDDDYISTYQMTDQDLTEWAYGHLFSEGIIDRREDVENVRVREGKISVTLAAKRERPLFEGRTKYSTSGCGNGATFFSMQDVMQFRKVESDLHVSLTYLLKKRHEFAKASPLYLETGGMHGACIITPADEVIVYEDIGRHNAVDKVIGRALLDGREPSELILLTTGRISYEMLAKCARFGFGIVGSRTAATKQSVQLASFLGVEIVGYIRGRMSFVYTKKGRVTNDLENASTS